MMFDIKLNYAIFTASINDAIVNRVGQDGICLVVNPGWSAEMKDAARYTDVALPVVYLSKVPIDRIYVHDCSIESNVGYVTGLAHPIHCKKEEVNAG